MRSRYTLNTGYPAPVDVHTSYPDRRNRFSSMLGSKCWRWPMCRSYSVMGPPGTVTTTRQSGARYARQLLHQGAGIVHVLEHLRANCVGRPGPVLGRRRLVRGQVDLQKRRIRDALLGDLDAGSTQLEPQQRCARVRLTQRSGQIARAGADVEHAARRRDACEEPQDQPTAEVLSGVLGGRLGVLGPVLVPVVPLMGRDAHAKEDTERVRPR